MNILSGLFSTNSTEAIQSFQNYPINNPDSSAEDALVSIYGIEEDYAKFLTHKFSNSFLNYNAERINNYLASFDGDSSSVSGTDKELFKQEARPQVVADKIENLQLEAYETRDENLKKENAAKIETYLKDESPVVRTAAIDNLALLIYSSGDEEFKKTESQKLFPYLDDADSEVKEKAKGRLEWLIDNLDDSSEIQTELKEHGY